MQVEFVPDLCGNIFETGWYATQRTSHLPCGYGAYGVTQSTAATAEQLEGAALVQPKPTKLA
jgi:hypothetical protein